MRTAVKRFAAIARPVSAGLLFASLACTTPKEVVKPDTGPGKQTPQANPNTKKAEPPPISNRALLLFEDANKAAEAQRRAKTPDYASLERKYQAALEADPKLAEAEYDLGVLAERQGRTDEAIKHYQAALQKKPSLKQASINLAVIAENQGDLPKAIALYQGVLSTHPQDAMSRSHLADIFRRQGDHDKAMDLARQALMRDPKALLAYKVMMLSYLERKQLAMAKLVALRATKIDDSDPELYQTVAMVLLAEGQTVAAKAQLKKAVEVRPDFVPARIELARMALKDEDYPGAEEHLRRILQVNGKSAEAHLNLGVAYKGMGQVDKAMQEYDAAEKLDPNLAAIYLNRGVILLRNKDAPEKAEEYFKKYLSLTGEGAGGADAPVLALLKEAEQVIQAKAEAKRAEEEAKKLQEAQKAQQEKLKQAEAEEAAKKGGGNAIPAKAEGGKPDGTPATAPTPAKGAAPDTGKSGQVAAPTKAPAKAPGPDKDEPKDDVL